MKAWLLTALIAATASAENLENRGFIPSSRSRSRSMAASHARAVHQGGGTVAHVAGPAAGGARAVADASAEGAPSSSGVAALDPKAISKPKVSRRRLTGDLTPIPGVAGPSVAMTGMTAEKAGPPASGSLTTAAAGAPIGVDAKRAQNSGGAGAFVGDKDSAPGSSSSSSQDASAATDPLGNILNNIKKMFSGLLGGAS